MKALHIARTRRHFRMLEVALLAIFLSVPLASQVEAGGRELRRLLESLELADLGVARWLLALGVTGNDTRQERLIAMTTSHELVQQIVGDDFTVTIGPELMAKLDQPGSDIVLIHNHPTSSSLSWADISFLSKPGVAAVVAVGHDGSVYAAMRGRRFACERVSRLVYQRAATAARARLDLEIKLSPAVAEGVSLPQYLTHLIADALRSLRVIEYRAVMSAERSRAYGSHRDLFEGSLSAYVTAVLSRPIS